VGRSGRITPPGLRLRRGVGGVGGPPSTPRPSTQGSPRFRCPPHRGHTSPVRHRGPRAAVFHRAGGRSSTWVQGVDGGAGHRLARATWLSFRPAGRLHFAVSSSPGPRCCFPTSVSRTNGTTPGAFTLDASKPPRLSTGQRCYITRADGLTLPWSGPIYGHRTTDSASGDPGPMGHVESLGARRRGGPGRRTGTNNSAGHKQLGKHRATPPPPSAKTGGGYRWYSGGGGLFGGFTDQMRADTREKPCTLTGGQAIRPGPSQFIKHQTAAKTGAGGGVAGRIDRAPRRTLLDARWDRVSGRVSSLSLSVTAPRRSCSLQPLQGLSHRSVTGRPHRGPPQPSRLPGPPGVGSPRSANRGSRGRQTGAGPSNGYHELTPVGQRGLGRAVALPGAAGLSASPSGVQGFRVEP